MLEYYKSRQKYLQRVYGLCAGVKIGHIFYLGIVLLSREDGYPRKDSFLRNLYPETEEGDTDLEQARMIALVQHVIGAYLFISAIVILNKSVTWARLINPIILTVSLVLETPILPVYPVAYLVFQSGAHFSFSFLMPMIICETFAAMLFSWVLIFSSLTLGVARNIDAPLELGVVIVCWIICFLVNFLIVKDMQVDRKQTTSL